MVPVAKIYVRSILCNPLSITENSIDIRLLGYRRSNPLAITVNYYRFRLRFIVHITVFNHGLRYTQ
ncbi:LOW QUALITY PROTEIN: hypothetical protein TorRG33x02_231650 [Trema orientale]|uniref:Uncharacterized protein n=1 Tax=Trema orientale TaxID=63057 RepID=A0A2P5E669_TREOI|nr:LOW QUALITY PROTEIN: hypothetical protein TorRG33x02_231650 [Trema orientale]